MHAKVQLLTNLISEALLSVEIFYHRCYGLYCLTSPYKNSVHCLSTSWGDIYEAIGLFESHQ